jgi:four helix bundle protein
MQNDRLNESIPARESSQDDAPDIHERCMSYALRAVRLYQALTEKGYGPGREIGRQFFRAATSIGANLAEARSAQSKADFVHKANLSLKEARESSYWLELLHRSGLVSKARLDDIRSETDEIQAILVTIIMKTKKNMS